MLKKINNKNRYKTPQPCYWYLRDRGVNYLFTKNALTQAEKRALKNPKDLPLYEKPNDKFMNGFASGFVVGGLLAIVTFIILMKFGSY